MRMHPPIPTETSFQIAQAKTRVWATLTLLGSLVLILCSECGKPRGSFHYPAATSTTEYDPWRMYFDPYPLQRPQAPLYVFEPYPISNEPLGPPAVCRVHDPLVERDDDILLAYQYWMGIGYPTADLLVRRNRKIEYDALPFARPWDFPSYDCTAGVLSEKTMREFYDLVDRLHLCEDPPQPTWENIGIDALCLRKGNEVCMIGIGNENDPRQHVVRMAVGRLAIYACTSQFQPPSPKTTM